MANIRKTAVDILERCRDRTLKDGYQATEEVLEEPFVEHLWTTEFKIAGNKIVHEFVITSGRSGIVDLDMYVSESDGLMEAGTIAEFHFKYLSVNTIASAMAEIVERS